MKGDLEPELKRIPWGKPRWAVGCFLLVVWVLMSGKLDVFHGVVGIFAVVTVLWFDRRLGRLKEDQLEEGVPLQLHYDRGLFYLVWLYWEVMLSAFHVGQVIFGIRKLDPALVSFRTDEPHTVARVVLANSITLTPGTIIVHIDGDRFLVYGLTEDARDTLYEGRIQKKVAYVFGRKLEVAVTDWYIEEEPEEI